jgi:hypothetical protein
MFLARSGRLRVRGKDYVRLNAGILLFSFDDSFLPERADTGRNGKEII